VIKGRTAGWKSVRIGKESPAAGQLGQVFPWFFSVLEQMLKMFPSSQLLLHASH
jgi:hypothetical protein